MPTLRFTQNVPQVIALQFSEGKIKPSSIPGNPDDMQYALATPPGMTAYLPISAAEMIRRAGITARQPFEICKVGKDDYRISTINGAGGRVVSAPETESQPPRSREANSQPPNYSADSHRSENHSRTMVSTNSAPPPPPERIYTAPAAPPVSGNGNRPVNPVAPPPEPPAERRVSPQASKLMSCFLDAIDAISESQAYATRRGLGITFSSENVTSAALSCYINECRNGGTR